MEILACCRGCKQFKVEVKLAFEIVADITDDLLLGCSSKARHRNWPLITLLLLQFADKVADIKIINAKILPPCRKAVCLINDKTNDVAGQQHFFNRL